MSLGGLLQWKSKEQIEEEAAKYEKWAFPFGEEQREAVTSLFSELLPKENSKIALISFLTCKELYDKSVKKTESQDEAIRHVAKQASKNRNLIRKHHLTTYLAVVLVDLDVDEQCDYGSADEVRERVAEIEAKLV